MTPIIIEYLTSWAGALINMVLFIGIAGFTYGKYSQCKGIVTGKYFTEGKITWSEHGRMVNNIDRRKESLISYSYSVGGRRYSDSFGGKGAFSKKLAESYPVGKKITVFYSPDDPEYSTVGKPPKSFELLLYIIIGFAFPMVIFINIPLLYIFWLTGVAK